MKQTLTFTLNNKPVSIEANPVCRLLDLLREDLGLTGTKESCGVGECGGCTVLLDGKAVNACLVLAGQIEGCSIITIEGLGNDKQLDILQQTFYENTAIQCGYCTPGMILSAKALLLANPNPTVEEIKTALAGNLCRCSGYEQIIRAVEQAAAALGGEGNE